MKLKFYFIIWMLGSTFYSQASKLAEVKVLDKDYIMIHFKDGEVFRRDDGKGKCAFYGHCHSSDGSLAEYYGKGLNVKLAAQTRSWRFKSVTDKDYKGRGLQPVALHRKSKLNGMTISEYDSISKDNIYDYTIEHFIYLKLPMELKQGKTYILEIAGNIQSDIKTVSFTYDIFNSHSEALHVNIWGYRADNSLKAADLYHWMGDGGPRDYSSFEGNKVYLFNTQTGETHDVGKVDFWKSSDSEFNGYNFSKSNVWNVDFTGFSNPGTYRLAVEGIGCSDDFEIAPDIYKEPFRVSTLGFFYMRLGQNSPDISPRPRIPLFIPGVDSTTVYISTLHPYHPEWEEVRKRVTDPWDHPREFAPYNTDRTNDNSWGGHSDAYDWDKRLQQVSIIYDMLLPYIITGGLLSDDNMGIAESGNGIPDILDEARYEVDAWLRLRDGKGYAHGRTCPFNEEHRVKFQGGTTAVAAWANALNSAMMAEAFRISGHEDLMREYADSAIVAFDYALNLPDQMLDNIEIDGVGPVRGRDFKMMAAGYLYNVTGNRKYEDSMARESVVISPESRITDTLTHNQIYGVAAYLFTHQKVNYPELYENMKQSVINEARLMEASYTKLRPSRRSTCNEAGYFWTIQNVQRTIIAHAITLDKAEKEVFLDALTLEADWSLGRNPANIIQMTTSSTKMANKRSVDAAFTSGYNDGVSGLHPGHTPYWNMNDWAPRMIKGRPSWMADKGYPTQNEWPIGELFFKTDYVWSHTEFTPQQTMRGKQALYGYLHSLTLMEVE
jgi:endoglucanase